MRYWLYHNGSQITDTEYNESMVYVREFEEIRDKISELDNRVSILEWLGSIPYSKTKEGILYKELPVSAKVFVIVHDLFQMKSQKPTDTQLHQAWDNIGLPDSIRLVDFLADFSQNTQYADLLHCYEYDYDYPYLSRFGKCLAKIIKMNEDSEKQECIRTCFPNVSGVDTIGLYFCDDLLMDMMRLREQYQARKAISESDVDEVIKEVLGENSIKVNIEIRSSEGYRLYYDYDNKRWNEGSSDMRRKPAAEVRLEGSSSKKTIPLNDFAAYLWSRSHKSQLPSGFTLVVIDYYDKDHYANAYRINAQGKPECIGERVFRYTKAKKTTRKILEELCGKYPDYVFRTFSAGKTNGEIKRQEKLEIYYELKSCLNVLCGENADEELKLLLEHFHISLDASKSSVVSNSVFW